MLVNNKKFEELERKVVHDAELTGAFHAQMMYLEAKECEVKNSNLESRLATMETRLDGLDLLLQQLLTCFSVIHIPAVEAETIPGDYIIAHEKMDEALAAGRTVEIKIGPKAERTIIELKKKR